MMRADALIDEINLAFGTSVKPEVIERSLKMEEIVASIEPPERQSYLEGIMAGSDDFFLARLVLEDIIEKTTGTYKVGKSLSYVPSKKRISINKIDMRGGSISKPIYQLVPKSEADQLDAIAAPVVAFAKTENNSFYMQWYLMEKGWRFLYSETLPLRNYLTFLYPEAKNFVVGFSTPYSPTLMNTSFLAIFDEPWENGIVMEEKEQDVLVSSSYAMDVLSLAEAYGKKTNWNSNDFLAFMLSEAEFKNKATMFKTDFSKTFFSPFYSTNPLYQLMKLRALEGREKALEKRKAAKIVRKWCSYLTLNGGVRDIKDSVTKFLDVSSFYVRLSGGLENSLKSYISKSRPPFLMIERKPYYQLLSILPGIALLEEGVGFVVESEKTALLISETDKADLKIVAYYMGDYLKLMVDNDVFSFRIERVNNNTAVIKDYGR